MSLHLVMYATARPVAKGFRILVDLLRRQAHAPRRAPAARACAGGHIHTHTHMAYTHTHTYGTHTQTHTFGDAHI